MRTIAIGDIHGCYDDLVDMITALEEDGRYNKGIDKLIFLGDYIDRGGDSNKVVAYIRELQRKNKNVIALRGNHEDMCIDYFKTDYKDTTWFNNGGYQTIKSYDGNYNQLAKDVYWMQHLPLYHEDDNFVYVHAGIDVTKPMNEQKEYSLLWVRENFIYNSKQYHKKVIFGHTPSVLINHSTKPYYTSGGNIGIDTACVFGGCLTALIINDNEIEGYYQIEHNLNTEETEKIN